LWVKTTGTLPLLGLHHTGAMIGTSQVIQAHEFQGGALKHVYTFFNIYPYLGK